MGGQVYVGGACALGHHAMHLQSKSQGLFSQPLNETLVNAIKPSADKSASMTKHSCGNSTLTLDGHTQHSLENLLMLGDMLDLWSKRPTKGNAVQGQMQSDDSTNKSACG